MTITDTGRRSREQIVEEARALVAAEGKLPSKTALSKSLRTHFTTASEIHDLLAEERHREATRRHRERRLEIRRTGREGVPRRFRGVEISPCTTPDQDPVTDVDIPLDEPAPEGPVQAPAPMAVTAPVPASPTPSVAPAPPAPVTAVAEGGKRRPRSWPLLLLTLPAFVSIWGGWVDMGRLTGFGVVHPFPGIPGLDEVAVNMAITLPVSLETYAAYALYVWLSGAVPPLARAFAKWSAIGSLALGAAGQIAYHLMVAAGITIAPWQITTVVACLPVAVLGMGAALRHLVHAEEVN